MFNLRRLQQPQPTSLIFVLRQIKRKKYVREQEKTKLARLVECFLSPLDVSHDEREFWIEILAMWLPFTEMGLEGVVTLFDLTFVCGGKDC